jgi:hypothetical protein
MDPGPGKAAQAFTLPSKGGCPLDINKELDEAYEGQVVRLFDAFFNHVLAAANKEEELTTGGERFKAGLDMLGKVLVRAREVAGQQP